jgi:hypothetical protein
VALLLNGLGGARIGDTWAPINLSEDYFRYRAQLRYAPIHKINVTFHVNCKYKKKKIKKIRKHVGTVTLLFSPELLHRQEKT